MRLIDLRNWTFSNSTPITCRLHKLRELFRSLVSTRRYQDHVEGHIGNNVRILDSDAGVGLLVKYSRRRYSKQLDTIPIGNIRQGLLNSILQKKIPVYVHFGSHITLRVSNELLISGMVGAKLPEDRILKASAWMRHIAYNVIKSGGSVIYIDCERTPDIETSLSTVSGYNVMDTYRIKSMYDIPPYPEISSILKSKNRISYIRVSSAHDEFLSALSMSIHHMISMSEHPIQSANIIIIFNEIISDSIVDMALWGRAAGISMVVHSSSSRAPDIYSRLGLNAEYDIIL